MLQTVKGRVLAVPIAKFNTRLSPLRYENSALTYGLIRTFVFIIKNNGDNIELIIISCAHIEYKRSDVHLGLNMFRNDFISFLNS